MSTHSNYLLFCVVLEGVLRTWVRLTISMMRSSMEPYMNHGFDEMLIRLTISMMRSSMEPCGVNTL